MFGKTQMHQVQVAVVSKRRVRELKRKEARQKDKYTINKLEEQVAWMKEEIAWWRTWYFQTWSW